MNQTELEQPAKNYQLKAVEAELKHISEKINVVINQTNGLATTVALEEAQKDMKDYVDNKVELVHSEYGPLKRNVTWFTKTLIGAVIGQVVSLGIIAYIAYTSLIK